jgi:Domain of unknown function (DUF4111)
MHEVFSVPSLAGFPNVLAVIRALQEGIPRVLGDTLVGLYLTGSLSYGGFDPASSDIALQTPDWAERIEGGYIWESMLPSLEPPSEPRPYINGSGAMWAPEPVYGQEWTMNLFVLHECGVALYGPPAADVFPHVSQQQMREASLRSLHEEWKPLLADDSLLDDPHYQAYITLTLCRILHAQKVDGVASKSDAAQWAKDTYGAAVRGTVERAEQWALGQPLDMKHEVLDLVRFTLAETGRVAAN